MLAEEAVFLVSAGGAKPLPCGSELQDVARDRDEDCERVSLKRRRQQGGTFSLDEMALSTAVMMSRLWVIAVMEGREGWWQRAVRSPPHHVRSQGSN